MPTMLLTIRRDALICVEHFADNIKYILQCLHKIVTWDKGYYEFYIFVRTAILLIDEWTDKR